MNYLIALFFLALNWSLTSTFAQGFENGEHYKTHKKAGSLVADCFDPRTGDRMTHYFRCSDSFLEPSEKSYFIFDGQTNADLVVFQVTYESGKTKSFKYSFDPKTNKSVKKVRLWNGGLLNPPLFRTGSNRIYYRLMEKKQKVEEGEFHVQVDTGSDKRCLSARWVNPFRCRDRFFLCRQYLNDRRYCGP